jgi:hypothetical protein
MVDREVKTLCVLHVTALRISFRSPSHSAGRCRTWAARALLPFLLRSATVVEPDRHGIGRCTRMKEKIDDRRTRK